MTLQAPTATASTPPSRRGPATRAISQKVAVSVVFVAAMFMSIMDATIVNVALPDIGRDLAVRATAVSAVSIGYLVSLAVVIPASGWLGDRFGMKRVLLVAIVIFTLASALCGFAQTFGELVVSRVLQGVGGGMLTPVAMAMLFTAYPPEERVRASSIMTTPTALAPALGPVLGGILVTTLSWRWVFFVNLPIGILAVTFGALFLREQERPPVGRFDRVGFALSGLGFAALMYGVSEGPQRDWHDHLVLLTIVVGVVLIAAMVRQQMRTAEPILKLRLFTDRLFRSVNAVTFLSTAAFLGVLYLVALFFQDGLGLSALGSGLSTFPEALGVMAGAQSASRLFYPRLGPRRMMSVGLLGVGTAMALMSLIDNRGELWQMRALMVMLGLCMAHVFVPAQAAAFARVSRTDTGRASTVFNALRQLGGASGVAILTTAVTLAGARAGGAAVAAGTTSPLHPFHVAFLVAAGLAATGALLSLTIHDADADITRVRRGRNAP